MATEVNNFCETPGKACTFGYCDENGCQDRKRNYTAFGISLLHTDDILNHIQENIGNEDQIALCLTELGKLLPSAPADETLSAWQADRASVWESLNQCIDMFGHNIPSGLLNNGRLDNVSPTGFERLVEAATLLQNFKPYSKPLTVFEKQFYSEEARTAAPDAPAAAVGLAEDEIAELDELAYNARQAYAAWEARQSSVGLLDATDEADIALARVAADAMPTLLAALRTAATPEPAAAQSGWVSCAERLPENEEDVLIALPGGAVIGACLLPPWDDTALPDATVWACNDGHDYSMVQISHWMEYPKGPESND